MAFSADTEKLAKELVQAEKNTKWHKTLKTWLEEQGFKCSMHYQMD